jgi:hypothetical protein
MKSALIGSLLAIAVPGAWFFWKLPPQNLSPAEKELIAFTSPPLTIARPRQQSTFSGLDSPVRAAVIKPPPTPAAAGANPPARAWKPARRISFDSRPALSMIYCEGSIKTAIIDGHVLHEGSQLGKNRIERIERTRVLMRGSGKDIWLSID